MPHPRAERFGLKFSLKGRTSMPLGCRGAAPEWCLYRELRCSRLVDGWRSKELLPAPDRCADLVLEREKGRWRPVGVKKLMAKAFELATCRVNPKRTTEIRTLGPRPIGLPCCNRAGYVHSRPPRFKSFMIPSYLPPRSRIKSNRLSLDCDKLT